MKIIQVFLIASICFSAGLSGQQYWLRSYQRIDGFVDLFPGAHGDCYAVTSTNNAGWNFQAIDSAGNMYRQFPLIDSNYLNFSFFPELIAPLRDGNFLLGSIVFDTNNQAHEQLRKFNAAGEVLWTRLYPNRKLGLAVNARQISFPDNSFLFASYTQSTKKTRLVWLDSTGAIVQEKPFPDSTISSMKSMTGTPDGTVYVWYETTGISIANVLARLDAAGNFIWKTNFPLAYQQTLYTTPDAGVVVAEIDTGYTTFLVKRDSSGVIQWQTPIPSKKNWSDRIIPAAGGDCYLLSTYGPNPLTGQRFQGDLTHIDELGEVGWTRKLYFPEKIYFEDYAFKRQPDGGLVFGAAQQFLQANNHYKWFLMVIKMDSLGFRLPNRIAGTVRHDENLDCAADTLERPLAGWIVRLEKNGEPDLYATTDSMGNFIFDVDTGAYTVHLASSSSNWMPCPAAQNAGSAARYDTVRVDFPVQAQADCPLAAVHIGARQLERCKTSAYTIRYCNPNPAPTDTTILQVVPDPFLQFVDADIPPFQISGDTLWFAATGLETGQCRQFKARFNLSCASVAGQTHCVEARVFPDNYCSVPPLWSGADIRVSATCAGDTLLHLRLANTGNAPTGVPAPWRIFRDSAIVLTGNASLMPGAILEKTFPADGSFWGIEAEQEPYHPWRAPQRAFVEGCGGFGQPGYPAQYGVSTASPFEAISCLETDAVSKIDDKRAFPAGYGPDHLIRPTEPIEYTIQFHNPLYDLLDWVILYDTLSPFLDPATVEPGAGSHDYQWEVFGPNMLKFTVRKPNIKPVYLYPDEAYGFIRFKIQQRENPAGTLIPNCAEVVLHRYEPRTTNCTAHRVESDFVPVTVNLRPTPGVAPTVFLSPNPARDAVELRWQPAQPSGDFQVVLRDMTGAPRRYFQTDTPAFTLRRDNWPAGLYLLEVWQHGVLLGHDKAIFID